MVFEKRRVQTKMRINCKIIEHFGVLLTFALNFLQFFVNCGDVINQKSLVTKDLTAETTLMLLEVSPQVLSHRLVCPVLLLTYITAQLEQLPMIVDVQAQFVLVIGSELAKIAVIK